MDLRQIKVGIIYHHGRPLLSLQEQIEVTTHWRRTLQEIW